MIGTISLLLIVMWGLFIFGVIREDDIFIFIAGCGLLLISITMMTNGLEGINNFITQGIAVVHVGVGALAVLSPLLNLDKWE